MCLTTETIKTESKDTETSSENGSSGRKLRTLQVFLCCLISLCSFFITLSIVEMGLPLFDSASGLPVNEHKTRSGAHHSRFQIRRRLKQIRYKLMGILRQRWRISKFSTQYKETERDWANCIPDYNGVMPYVGKHFPRIAQSIGLTFNDCYDRDFVLPSGMVSEPSISDVSLNNNNNNNNNNTTTNNSDTKRNINDRIDRGYSMEKLGLSPENAFKVRDTLARVAAKYPDAFSVAKQSGWKLSEHLVYRYYASSDFKDTFYEYSVEDAVYHTLLWRASYGIADACSACLTETPALDTGFLYQNGVDRAQRPLIYFKVDRNSPSATADDIVKFLMHTVEESDRASVDKGSGEFVTIVDLKGLSFSNAPPLAAIRESIGLLKRNYPWRLNAIYVLNGGGIFDTLWSVIKPLISPKAASKIIILRSKEAKPIIHAAIGRTNLEVEYQ